MVRVAAFTFQFLSVEQLREHSLGMPG